MSLGGVSSLNLGEFSGYVFGYSHKLMTLLRLGSFGLGLGFFLWSFVLFCFCQ